MIEVAVLGGGIAGITAAYFASQAGQKAVVFEAKERAGGLLDNFTIQGFRFDHAVHLSFATEPEVRGIFDQTDYYTHPSDSLCFDNGIWLKHPVQNNLFPLSVEERTELIKSFIARPEIDPKNYREWLIHQYGEKLAERYPLRYTQKYWTVDARELSTNWIGQRMRRADLTEVLRGAMSAETPNTYYTNEMRYPKKGGYRAFLDPMLSKVPIETKKRCTKIESAKKTLHFADGTTAQYKHLISSLPLPVIAELLDPAPDAVREAAAKLFATTIDLVSVGVRGSKTIKPLWFYIYDEGILAARCYSPSVKSPDNAPADASSIQFEIYSSRHAPQRLSNQELVENCLNALEAMKVTDRASVLFTDVRRLEYGNVVFYNGMEQDRAVVLDYLKSLTIQSIGRFGEWDYLWSHQAFMSGKRAADKLAVS